MRTSRIAAALLLAAMLPRPAMGQEPATEEPSAWRRYAFAAAGAAVLGGLATLAKEGHEGAFCASKSCLVPLGVSVGTVVGFLLGADLDQRARARWTGASTIRVSRAQAGLDSPVRLLEHPQGAVALETGHVTLLTPTLSPRRLLTEPRTRDAVALPARSALIVAADQGIWGLPFGDGAPQRLREDGATALAALSGGDLLVAGRNAIERAALPSGSLALQGGATATLQGVPVSMAAAGDVVFVVMDSTFEARRASSLERLGGLTLDAWAADLVLGSGVALVPLGTRGVAVIDVSDPTRPREVARLTNMGQAYAAAVAGDEAYIAGGAQGVFVYDISARASPRLVGVIPDVGLATDVATSGGALWVLDRTGRRVIRIEGAGGLGARAAAAGGG